MPVAGFATPPPGSESKPRREAITCQEPPSSRSRRIAAIDSARAASSGWRAMANAAAAVGTTTDSALPCRRHGKTEQGAAWPSTDHFSAAVNTRPGLPAQARRWTPGLAPWRSFPEDRSPADRPTREVANARVLRHRNGTPQRNEADGRPLEQAARGLRPEEDGPPFRPGDPGVKGEPCGCPSAWLRA
jgi:hypothetical protein